MGLMGKIKEKTAKTEGLGKAGIRFTNEDLVSVAGGGGIDEEWLVNGPSGLDFTTPAQRLGMSGSPQDASGQ